MALADDALGLAGFTEGGTVYGGGGGGKGGKGGSATDWSKVSQLLGNVGNVASKAGTSDAAYDKRGGEGPGPSQTATQGLPNLLATLIQMHRAAMLSQATAAPLQPRASLLG